jgi:hypothetical protein
MAFEQLRIKNAWVESFTTSLSDSSENNLLNQGIPASNVMLNELRI